MTKQNYRVVFSNDHIQHSDKPDILFYGSEEDWNKLRKEVKNVVESIVRGWQGQPSISQARKALKDIDSARTTIPMSRKWSISAFYESYVKQALEDKGYSIETIKQIAAAGPMVSESSPFWIAADRAKRRVMPIVTMAPYDKQFKRYKR